jgi:histidine ammonia-lyase
MSVSRTIAVGAPRLAIRDVDDVARRRMPCVLAADAVGRIERSHVLVRRLAEGDAAIYGLTTGCGPLAGNRIGGAEREAFQRNLVRSHAVSLGTPHPPAFVRAAMLARAHVLALGYSGVAPAVIETLIGMLNAGIHPIVGEIGGVGASGDLVELAQIALAVLGEGEVEVDGARQPAAAALARAGLAPLVPRFREGLALMNGTSFHTGVAALLVARARRVSAAAEVAATMSFDALGGAVEALDPALHAVRPHAGARGVAERLAGRVRGSQLTRGGGAAAQDAYTLRCIPQIVGAALDTIGAASAVIETEINAVSDNPVFLEHEGRAVHGGNFHGQPVALALDQLKLAAVGLGVIAERRIARLLDPALNAGLPAFLIRNGAGLRSGLMGLQYCATTLAAENAALAAPASVRSIPTNANNQDVVSMAMLAARHAARMLDNVAQLVAIELLCATQAVELRGVERAAPATRAAVGEVRGVSAAVMEDRPLAGDVKAIGELIEIESFNH